MNCDQHNEKCLREGGVGPEMRFPAGHRSVRCFGPYALARQIAISHHGSESECASLKGRIQ